MVGYKKINLIGMLDFGLKQGMANFEYLWHVFQILSPYCQSLPYSTKNFMRG